MLTFKKLTSFREYLRFRVFRICFVGRLRSFTADTTSKESYVNPDYVESYIANVSASPNGNRPNKFAVGQKWVIDSLQQKSEMVRVLDFGGGYMALARAISLNRPDLLNKMNYTLFDTPTMVDAVKRFDAHNPMFSKFAITYVSHFEDLELSDHYDIIYLGSSLQYFVDWENTLLMLARNADEIIIDDLPTVVGPSIISRQTVPGHASTVNLLNLSKFIDTCARYGLVEVQRENVGRFMFALYRFSLRRVMSISFRLAVSE